MLLDAFSGDIVVELLGDGVPGDGRALLVADDVDCEEDILVDVGYSSCQ